jgi:uncharacterized SAM-dependent methyltransferase
MHLVSTREQAFTLRAADLRVTMARGERILTEISRKFTRASAERLLSQSGLALTAWMTSPEGFALCLSRLAPAA